MKKQSYSAARPLTDLRYASHPLSADGIDPFVLMDRLRAMDL
jgi:hypothetical protein